ncbi:hypothetical protein [Desulfoferula mesophila]|uniref:F5/8 type C domain-containing protein n=1 Tax=Desulfoferula mesophila TaxID=3058419 RepID=A0AAU9EZM0_9BACT|nr:hypothetical protein FAK_01130 [Desulfoferula mesophilus]
MSTCRFMYDNFIPGPQALGVSSARPGMVGLPAAEALGSATCLAAGEHTGDLDQVVVVEIDSVTAGSEVGLATFRWKRQSAGAWEATGVDTSVSLLTLADGVRIKWVPGPGKDFYRGDRWSILATGRQGPQALMDRDRDNAWRATACAGQWIGADLGQARRVRALVLADHNLSDAASLTLRASDIPGDPAWSFAPGDGVVAATPALTRPHLVCFLDATHRYWRLELDDPANPEGLLRASLFYLGDSFAPQRTFRAAYTQGRAATRQLLKGAGGKVAGSSGALAAYYQLEFARLAQADVDGLEAMLCATHAGGEGGLRPLFFTPFESDPGQTLYGLPGAELSRQRAPGGRWNLGLSLQEVVRTDV